MEQDKQGKDGEEIGTGNNLKGWKTMKALKKWNTGMIALTLTLALGLLAVPGRAEAASEKQAELNKTELTLTVGKAAILRVKNAPKGKKVTWSTNDKQVATVSKKGRVTAKEAGTAKITAKVDKNKYTCKVTVKAKEKNASDVALLQKQIQQQKARGAKVPEDLDAEEYSWDKNGRLTSINWEKCGLKGSLSLKGISALKAFNCIDNKLTSLNVSGCKSLEYFYCSNNRLSSLKMNGCKALKDFGCEENKLKSLSVKGCKSLVALWCTDNRLESLDVSGCSSLSTLWCYNNKLKSLDVSGCTKLANLQCDSSVKVTGRN